MWGWLPLILVVTALGLILWRFSVRSRDIEDDSRYLYENGDRERYGEQIMRILRNDDSGQ